MQTSNPLLYSPYEGIHTNGPLRKIKLLPIKRLMGVSLLRIKKEFNIKQYLTLYTSIFVTVGILVATCLAVIQLN